MKIKKQMKIFPKHKSNAFSIPELMLSMLLMSVIMVLLFHVTGVNTYRLKKKVQRASDLREKLIQNRKLEHLIRNRAIDSPLILSNQTLQFIHYVKQSTNIIKELVVIANEDDDTVYVKTERLDPLNMENKRDFSLSNLKFHLNVVKETNHYTLASPFTIIQPPYSFYYHLETQSSN